MSRMEDPKDYGVLERLRAGDDVYFYPEGERATEVNNPIVWPWNEYSIQDSPRGKSICCINMAEGFKREI